MSPTPTRARQPTLSWSTAWKRVLQDAKDDLLPDPLGYADYAHNAAPHIERVRRSVRLGYTAHDVYEIEVPKPGFTLRPGTTLEIDDRVLYHALVATFATSVDRQLEPETVFYSHRVRRGRNSEVLFKSWIAAWKRAQRRIEDDYRTGYRYLLNTDLVAYYEHIDHRLLREQLTNKGVNRQTIDQLFAILSHWSDNRRFGIPQGHDPSSFLGNVYLDPVDKSMTRAGYRYFRYADDIFVFARSERELKTALKLLLSELRRLGLHIQERKTYIYEGHEIRAMVDSRLHELSAIDLAVGLGRRPRALGEIKKILAEVFKSPKTFNDRHFRKCINELRRLGSDMAVRRILNRLVMLAPNSRELAFYLAPFADRRSVKTHIANFLQDPNLNFYAWQEIWLVWILRHTATMPRQFLDWVRVRMLTAEHWAARSNYALLLGKLGDASDLDLISSNVSNRENLMETRCFLVALERMERGRRNGKLNRWKRQRPELTEVIDYVLSL